MLKRLILPFVALIALLTACSGKTQAIATSIPTNAPSPAKKPGCTVMSLKPTPGPTERSLFPPVSSSDWARGAESADVTIIEYSDYQCTICSGLASVLAQIEKDYPRNVRVV
ncbi:MAG TPA: thioredoxin domain-containing protein, partial [Xanthomonadales bacterium]|nr:thioredoxin domain-containing protein [Xanthomonadales bacterium]